jgi:ABC-type amino acid transport substrate-binding protein
VSERIRTILLSAGIVLLVAAVLTLAYLFTLDTSFRIGPEEERALSSIEPLRVGYVRNDPPFSYRTESGLVTGMSNDAVREIAKLLGITVTFVEIDPSQFNEAMRTGRVDLLACPSVESSASGSVRSVSLYKIPISVFSSPDKKHVSDLRSLGTVGIVIGDPAENYIRNYVTGVMLSREPNYDKLVFMLAEGKIPAIAGKEQTIRFLSREKGIEGKMSLMRANLTQIDLCLHIRSEDQQVRNAFERAVTEMLDSGALMRIEKTYIGVDLTEHRSPHVKLLYAVLVLLALSIIATLVAWFTSPKGAPKGAENYAKGLDPLSEVSGSAPLTRFGIRQLLASMARNLRLIHVIYYSPDGEIVTVPETLRLPGDEDSNDLLQSVKQKFPEPLSDKNDWIGWELPRGGQDRGKDASEGS